MTTNSAGFRSVTANVCGCIGRRLPSVFGFCLQGVNLQAVAKLFHGKLVDILIWFSGVESE